MQTESLPSVNQLKKKAQKLVPKGKKARKKEAEEKAQQLAEQNLSPNLLAPLATKSFIMRARPKLAITAKTLALLTLAVFSALFITNMIFQIMLNRGEERRDELLEEINKNSYVEERIKSISSATNLYKETRKSNPDIADHLPGVVNAVQKELMLNTLAYNRGKNTYEINTTTNKASDYALMLAEVLNIEQVKSITIDYVSYEPQLNEYKGSFIINLK